MGRGRQRAIPTFCLGDPACLLAVNILPGQTGVGDTGYSFLALAETQGGNFTGFSLGCFQFQEGSL